MAARDNSMQVNLIQKKIQRWYNHWSASSSAAINKVIKAQKTLVKNFGWLEWRNHLQGIIELRDGFKINDGECFFLLIPYKEIKTLRLLNLTPNIIITFLAFWVVSGEQRTRAMFSSIISF